MRRSRAGGLAVVLACGVSGSAGLAFDPAALQEAAEGVATAETPEAERVALARLITEQEAMVAHLRQARRTAAAGIAAAEAQLAAAGARLASLTALARKLGSDRAAPLPLLHPGGAASAARAAALTAALTEEASADYAALAADLAALAQAQSEAAEAVAALAAMRGGLSDSRAALVAAGGINWPEALPPLDTLAAFDAPAQPAAAPQGLPFPITAIAPPASSPPGWLVQAEPGAPVLSPAPSTVLYAGRLRGLGQAVVLELAPGYTLILAGLGTLAVSAGDDLSANAVLGTLPRHTAPTGVSPPSPSEPHNNVTRPVFRPGGVPADALYIEARHADRPVTPAPWFAAE